VIRVRVTAFDVRAIRRAAMELALQAFKALTDWAKAP